MEGNLTPEQREHLKRQIDARIRETLGDRRGASPGGRAKKSPKPRADSETI